MKSRENNYQIEDLLKEVKKYNKEKASLKRIEEAYFYAEEKHEGQYRKSGEKYIIHPLASAMILTTIYADDETIIAGLLHDVLEDCDVTKEELEEKFGKEVADLVYGVTKINKIKFSTANENLIEYYKKIIVGMSEDVRVIIIKLADRLHNMRTLWALSPEKQKEKSKETIEILAPIAHHLGINKIKSELEDLALKYLKPNVFYDIAENLNNTKLERDNAVQEMINTVSELLLEHHITHSVKGRSKSIYSIYKKLEKGKKFSDIYDLLGLRIFVNTEQECYSSLGIIHSKFRPMPGRFKDYIAMPKANGYQSLHTTVFGNYGFYFELQIRTYEMDEIAENGLASHWAYKEHKSIKDGQSLTEQKLQFFKSIIELNEEQMSSEEFVNSVKDEILNDNIYVFTPKGDIFEMPKESTPIDFAYRVHTRVGETTTGAIVNNNIVPLDYKLNDNDIVKIITDKNSPGPSREWLNFVVSTQTKSKIKSFFSKTEKEKFLEKGKDYLEKALRKEKISFNSFLTDENIEKILKTIKYSNLEEVYINLGKNKILTDDIINIVYPKTKEDEKLKNIKFKDLPKATDSPIIVEGIDKIKVNIASCCNPIPGDDIIGYITKNNGISVHRTVCHNITYLENRLVHVKWNNKENTVFDVKIVITITPEKLNAILILLELASLSNIKVEGFKIIGKDEDLTYEVLLLVKSLEHLTKFMNDVRSKDFVKNVERIIE